MQETNTWRLRLRPIAAVTAALAVTALAACNRADVEEHVETKKGGLLMRARPASVPGSYPGAYGAGGVIAF